MFMQVALGVTEWTIVPRLESIGWTNLSLFANLFKALNAQV